MSPLAALHADVSNSNALAHSQPRAPAANVAIGSSIEHGHVGGGDPPQRPAVDLARGK
jgi:hypothetical protein